MILCPRLPEAAGTEPCRGAPSRSARVFPAPALPATARPRGAAVLSRPCVHQAAGELLIKQRATEITESPLSAEWKGQRREQARASPLPLGTRERVRIAVPTVPIASHGSSQRRGAAVAPERLWGRGLVVLEPSLKGRGAWRGARGNRSKALAPAGEDSRPEGGCGAHFGTHGLTSRPLCSGRSRVGCVRGARERFLNSDKNFEVAFPVRAFVAVENAVGETQNHVKLVEVSALL